MVIGIAFYASVIGVLHSIMSSLDTRKEYIDKKLIVSLKFNFGYFKDNE